MEARHILLVEEAPTQRRMMQEMLEHKLGVLVTSTATGREALQLCGVQSCPYAAILLDIHLPDMHGLDVVRKLRRYFAELPVIMLSDVQDMQIAVQAMRAGANDMILLPVSTDRLMLSLNDVLRPQQQSATCAVNPEQGGAFSLLNERGDIRRIHELEASIIRFALDHYNGHMSEVARKLGIGRSTLYRKVQDYGLYVSKNNRAA